MGGCIADFHDGESVVFRDQLSVVMYWDCAVQPLWTADHSDRFVSKGTFGDHKHQICLTVTALMTGLILGHLDGLGIGTILAAFTMGKVIGWIGEWMDQHVRFVSFLSNRA